MRIRKAIAMLLTAITLLTFAGCNRQNKGDKDTIIDVKESMEGVTYLGWEQMIGNDEYMFSLHRYLTPDVRSRDIGKYNLKTGSVTSVCLDELCDHRWNCKVRSNVLYFIYKDKLFYHSDKTTSENDYQSLVSYDIMSGLYEEWIIFPNSEIEHFYHIVNYGDYIYYVRSIPLTDKPVVEEDYRLSFCKMSLIDKKETVLFSVDEVPEIADNKIFLFINKDIAYFADTKKGKLFRVGIDGSGAMYLINDDDCPAEFAGYGTFLYEDYFYYLVYADKYDGITDSVSYDKYICRMNINDGKSEKISDERVRWFWVTNKSIYYQKSYDKSWDTVFSYIENEVPESEIYRTQHDGKNTEVFTELDSGCPICDVFCANNCLFFIIGFTKDKEMRMGILKVDINTGEQVYMNK